jgi:hypothetical protein
MHPYRITQPGGGGAQGTLQKLLQRIGAIEIHPIALAGESQAGQQARQAKDVVAVHVGDEEAPQLGYPQWTAQELVLGAFPAVE